MCCSCGQCGSLDCGGDVQLTVLCVPTGLSRQEQFEPLLIQGQNGFTDYCMHNLLLHFIKIIFSIMYFIISLAGERSSRGWDFSKVCLLLHSFHLWILVALPGHPYLLHTSCCRDTQNETLWKIQASSDSCCIGLCLFLMLGSIPLSRAGQVGE